MRWWPQNTSCKETYLSITASTDRAGLLWHLANANSFEWPSVVNSKYKSFPRRSTWKPHVCKGLAKSQCSARCPPLVFNGGTLYTKHSSTFIKVWRRSEPSSPSLIFLFLLNRQSICKFRLVGNAIWEETLARLCFSFSVWKAERESNDHLGLLSRTLLYRVLYAKICQHTLGSKEKNFKSKNNQKTTFIYMLI